MTKREMLELDKLLAKFGLHIDRKYVISPISELIIRLREIVGKEIVETRHSS